MFNLSQLLTIDYYWNSNPGGEFPLGFFLLGFFILLISLPRFLKNIAKGNKYLKKSMKKRLWKFILLGMLGTAFTLFRFAEVDVLSKRLWLYIVFVLAIANLIITLPKIYKDYKMRLKSVAREQNQ